MPLQDKLDAFRKNLEAGGPPYSAPAWVHEPMHRATAPCGPQRPQGSPSGLNAEPTPDIASASY
jgi:hypothetical protein